MQIQVRWVMERDCRDYCLVPQAIFSALSLSEQKIYRLHIGRLSRDIYMRPTDRSNTFLYLSPVLFNPRLTAHELVIFEHAELNIVKNNTGIYLGPVIGIFVKPKRLRVPGKYGPDRSHMVASQQKHFLCYYFSIHSIDWQRQRIRGLTLVPGLDVWIYAWFPLPNVIYDRGAGFTEEQKAAVREIRARFREKEDVRFINCLDYIGKWRTYKALCKNKEVAAYLPATVRYSSFSDVMSMLQQYGFIFLKSYYGSQGKQVMSIALSDNAVRLVYYAGALHELVLSDLASVKAHVEKFVADQKFIIQQGVRLLKYKDRLFDMRILLIKNNRGEWVAVSNYARIARKNLTVTNYCVGGECDFYSNLYPHLQGSLPWRNIPNENDIAHAARKIASAVDAAFGKFGELGIDMAVDVNGDLWLIEVNTKPDKNLVPGLDNFTVIDKQYLMVFDYARYLCDS